MCSRFASPLIISSGQDAIPEGSTRVEDASNYLTVKDSTIVNKTIAEMMMITILYVRA
jgi:hypothetical protein